VRRSRKAPQKRVEAIMALHATCTKGVIVAVACLFVAAMGAEAEQPSPPPAVDEATPQPQAPDDKTIKKAVMRCLSSADVTASGRSQGRFRGLVEEGEERYCLEQKQKCQSDPGGFPCRSFVKDYVP